MNLAEAGSSELLNAFIEAGKHIIQNLIDSESWNQIFNDIGTFLINYEKNQSQIYTDLTLVLSKENLIKIAKDLKNVDGYKLKEKLEEKFSSLMATYEIPHEYAEVYVKRLVNMILEEIKKKNPEIYDRYYQQDWRNEENKRLVSIEQMLKKLTEEIDLFEQSYIKVMSSGQIDIELKEKTKNPSIGIDFFCIDEEIFQNQFKSVVHNETIYIKGRSREEAIYCIINELWRIKEIRPIYVVKDPQSWNILKNLEKENNIYIPWFYANEIVAIKNNTNIFVLDENMPVFGKKVLSLHPRTFDTLSRCLKAAGMEEDKIHSFLKDTHGLYIQIKKQLFNGSYLKPPEWIAGLNDRAKKTCLLVGSWEETEGDKQIIELLYGDTYEKFIQEVLPYSRGEDSLLYSIKNHNGTISYHLACALNIWSYINVLVEEPIWKSYVEALIMIMNGTENLLTYDNSLAKLHAQRNGESLCWSVTLRKGMLNTLMIKCLYQKECSQRNVDTIVKRILDGIKTENQWKYISLFWNELCELSSDIILRRLEDEFCKDSSLLSLFENQSRDILFNTNPYVNILIGLEQFFLQKKYFYRAFRLLPKLNVYDLNCSYHIQEEILNLIFCIWMNYSCLQTVEEKMIAAERFMESDPQKAWECLYKAIPNRGTVVMCGELRRPKYREYTEKCPVLGTEISKGIISYINLLIQNMNCSIDRWEDMLNLSPKLSNEIRNSLFEQLFDELKMFQDKDVMKIKNLVRRHIFHHRFYSSSERSLSENEVTEYEQLLNKIKIGTPEYEYNYLFSHNSLYPLLEPVPYDQENKKEKNDIASKRLIQDKLTEFKEKGYKLSLLAQSCALEKYSNLGCNLSKYWNHGNWDFSVFKDLLDAQKSGYMAMDYLNHLKQTDIPYRKVIKHLLNEKYPIEIIAGVYRVEATHTSNTPLVSEESEEIKKEFWKTGLPCNNFNKTWVLIECKKYAPLEVYLHQIFSIHYEYSLTPEEIMECFTNIEKMSILNTNVSVHYDIKSLLEIIQNAYINDKEKCFKIARLEIFFMNVLEWNEMKCCHYIVNNHPEIYAQFLVSRVYDNENQERSQKNKYQMLCLYTKMQFCPTENNGKVSKDKLEWWIEEFHNELIKNNREDLFTFTLGRLFSYSPVGKDNYYPCEAVREMIEKYGDDSLKSNYSVETYNNQGALGVSAGKEGLRIAEKYKQTAEYFESRYPKVAEIYDDLSESYGEDAQRERLDAENGYYY